MRVLLVEDEFVWRTTCLPPCAMAPALRWTGGDGEVGDDYAEPLYDLVILD